MPRICWTEQPLATRHREIRSGRLWSRYSPHFPAPNLAGFGQPFPRRSATSGSPAGDPLYETTQAAGEYSTSAMGGRMALGSTGLESSTFRNLNQIYPA